jgi:hypothetical protein
MATLANDIYAKLKTAVANANENTLDGTEILAIAATAVKNIGKELDVTYRVENGNANVDIGDYIFADTQTGEITITFPNNTDLTIGDVIFVRDIKGTFDNNKCTVDGNGKNVNGNTSVTLERKWWEYKFVYDGNEWKCEDIGNDLEFEDSGKGVILRDRSNGKRYRLFVENDQFGIEEI